MLTRFFLAQYASKGNSILLLWPFSFPFSISFSLHTCCLLSLSFQKRGTFFNLISHFFPSIDQQASSSKEANNEAWKNYSKQFSIERISFFCQYHVLWWRRWWVVRGGKRWLWRFCSIKNRCLLSKEAEWKAKKKDEDR